MHFSDRRNLIAALYCVAMARASRLTWKEFAPGQEPWRGHLGLGETLALDVMTPILSVSALAGVLAAIGSLACGAMFALEGPMGFPYRPSHRVSELAHAYFGPFSVALVAAMAVFFSCSKFSDAIEQRARERWTRSDELAASEVVRT